MPKPNEIIVSGLLHENLEEGEFEHQKGQKKLWTPGKSQTHNPQGPGGSMVSNKIQGKPGQKQQVVGVWGYVWFHVAKPSVARVEIGTTRFYLFFFYKGGIGKIIWRVKMIVIQYKNCYSGLITKKSLSGEEVFFAPASLETNYY